MKKLISLTLSLILIFALAVPAFGAQNETASPYLLNTQRASVSVAISDSGLLSTTVTCIGKSNVTSISTVTYVERKVGSSWVRVDIDATNDQWTYSTTSSRMVKSYSQQLTLTGQYRVVSECTVVSPDGTEVLDLNNTATW